MSIFETPLSQRQFQPSVYAAPATNTLYPEVPTDLRTPARTSNTYGGPPGASAGFVTPERPADVAKHPQQQQQLQKVPPTADNLSPVARAARTVNEYLTTEARYPQLDDIVSQGQSSDYDLPRSPAWEPFQRLFSHTIPDSIFEQYNRATSHTLMGLFAELKQAWITVDNRLYMWDYTTQGSFQGYEDQPNNITAMRLLTPKKGVFVESVNYVLVVATTVDIFLMPVKAVTNSRGGKDVTLLTSPLSVPTKGLGVSIIEGSKNTGRIFFGGRGDNDVYEFTYQVQEKWFHGKYGKICHTNGGVSSFAPRLPFWGSPKDTEYIVQMVMDDTRNLLYTLSSKSAIRAFHVKGDTTLQLTITHSFSHTLANIRVMIGNTPLLEPKTPIIAISPVTSSEARRTHLIAVTTSGCRLYMSAVTSEYGFGGTDAAPTAMQVIHVRFPPSGTGQSSLKPTRKAKVFPPGYFFCFVDKPDSNVDELFLSAPDSGKIALLAESGTSRLQLAETGMTLQLDSRVEAVELVSAPFGASKGPNGFGNEAAVQYDMAPTEVAILTNSGIHIIKRRRLVEVFDAAIRYGSAGSPLGVEGEVRKFFETYGRGEGCASALAVACGASIEVNQMQTRITDVEVCDLARKYFIEFGGKPRTESVYDSYDQSALPSLDNIKVSGRAEGIALYISRIVRSIWKSVMIVEAPGPAPMYKSNVPIPKLKGIQEQLVRLAKFLQTNRSFIVGLSGAESLMGLGSRVEEVAQQAEHRMLHALLALIESMIEGISFVLFLFDDKLDDIIASLLPAQQEEVKRITYDGLFTTESGQALAKDLVTAIVNRNIAAGMNVDTIADALRRRCGTFCSADDVVVFKAIEQVRRAKNETSDPDARNKLLRESLRLFEETAGSLTMENLRDTLAHYRELGYYPGAVQLALKVANEHDRGNEALGFLADGGLDTDPRASFYHKRVECYRLIFEVLEELDRVFGTVPEMIDGVPSPATRIRNETWTLVHSSLDETFHNTLYDWLFTRGGGGSSKRLLDVDSPHVLSYLKRTSVTSLPHSELLWQYYARREDYFTAAEVLHKLAQSDFDLTLGKRLEFLSRARGFCHSYGPMGTRQKMNELSHMIQEELDVAAIQDDILKKIKDDDRITPAKKEKLSKELDANLMSLSDLFNKYADPYGYMEICLAIFQGADYRGANEIRKCWEQLISQVHAKAVADQRVQPFELVADTVRRLGARFSLSEYIFPPNDLVPLLEIYAYENQRDVGPPTWVVDTLSEAGIANETILRILDEMFWRDEVPFKGTARRRLVRDAVFVAEKWFAAAVRRGGEAALKTEMVKNVLHQFAQAIPDGTDKERIVRLIEEITKRLG
ncbi:uncharacterized protein H6S33_002181 [Morchella sextelata]|uniref:uncharacterized protein n=1 Tax=Morchella sextelata TaxID=1174677 RepID=UPI001D05B590|nr:uncharacterized protein H6S33_002181 [Morchella sextelata]KAH0608129.1 hypothetical protein H6S33_002181 [Morchella sextelata]